MSDLEMSVVIKRPIEEAFAFLANLENDVKWHSAFVEVRNTSSGSLGVGARFLVFEGVLGRRTPGTEYEVTEYEPNRIAAWKTVSGPLQLKLWRTFERVDGGTRFVVRYEGEAGGFLKAGLAAHHQDGQAKARRRYAQAEGVDGSPRVVSILGNQFTGGNYVNRK